MSTDLNIMIIDDNQANNLYHRIMIEDAGLNTDKLHEYTSASEAIVDLHKLKVNHSFEELPKIILLDINMPIMNGWEFIDQLKALNLGTEAPEIYIVSNSRHPSDIEKAHEEALIVDICEKPLHLDFFQNLKVHFEEKPISDTVSDANSYDNIDHVIEDGNLLKEDI